MQFSSFPLAKVTPVISLGFLSVFMLCNTTPASATSLPVKRLATGIPKAVFAHHIVGNTASYTVNDWITDITKAQAAGIDAFALNIASQTSYTTTQLNNAYNAATQRGFKLFLSFDYAAQGPWNAATVVSTINNYANNGAQFKVSNKALVSTFEGPGNAADWTSIKSQTNIFFLPDWTSVGPDAYRTSYAQYTDGFFSWDGWPVGATDKTEDADHAWVSAVGNKAYMMPVSPWFYTNLPEYNKNWLWRGDDLWHIRWQQVLDIQPNFVEIITWNDYGESHYIGPIVDAGVPAGAHKYIDGMPHEHWRDLLPFYIAAYKNQPRPSGEKVQLWYRLSPAAAGSSDGTTGNAPYQPPVDPNSVVQDKVFYTTALTAAAQVKVQIGSNAPDTFQATAGLFHGSTPFNGRTGTVTVNVVRNGVIIATASGVPIVSAPANGKTNYNAYVAGSG